jgi:hypothetical protein
MFKLYLIDLNDEKKFLYYSSSSFIDEINLFKECQLKFDFVKKYPPIQILNVFDITNELEINFFIKYYMIEYGINNVRGGNYTDEILSDNTIEFLNLEIFTKFSDYEKKNDLLNIHPNEENKEENINRIMVYNNKKKLYNLLFNPMTNCNLQIDKDEDENINNIRNILNDFYWINQEIEYLFDKFKIGLINNRFLITNINNFNNIQYKKILKNIKNIVDIYFLLNEENLSEYLTPYLRTKLSSIKKYNDKDLIYIYHPNFLLDNFFYHHRVIFYWNIHQFEKQISMVNHLIDDLTNISYTVLNLLDELEFDIIHH